jgi:hypothetical protein
MVYAESGNRECSEFSPDSINQFYYYLNFD